MSEMQDKFKNYVQEKIMDINELSELAYVLALEPADTKTMPMVLLKIGGVVSSIDKGLAGEKNMEMFDALYTNGEFEEAYQLVKSVFMHYFVAITVKVKGYEKSLQRKLLIPFRESLADVIYATLASFRAKGDYEATIKKDGTYFTPISIIDDNDLCADIYSATILYTLKGGTIFYNYDEDYRFIITMRKPVYVKKDYEASVIVEGAKGYGIVDDDKTPIDDYFYKDIINHDFNWADSRLNELKEDIEERYLNIRDNFENFNVDYESFDDEDDLDTTDIS